MSNSAQHNSRLSNSLSINVELDRGNFHLSVDCNIDLSGVTAIFGKSGAGKSSLLRVIAGLDRIPGAEVSFSGQVWQSNSKKGKKAVWIPAHLRRVGYVFQQPSLFEHLTVEGNLQYARKRSPGKATSFSEQDILRSLGVVPLLSRSVQGLSGGEKQRVAIARALVSNPGLLIMDEPVSALDSRSKEEVLEVVQWMHESIDIPMLYVSHSLSEVARLADSVLLMRQGRVIEQGDAASMMLHPEISADPALMMETIVNARVAELDKEYGLYRLEFAGGSLWVGHKNLTVGQYARARIMARDLSLTLDKPENTSIQNIVTVRITGLRELVDRQNGIDSQCLVELDANGCMLLAQITRRSVDRLGLSIGQAVYAQIKSVALLA